MFCHREVAFDGLAHVVAGCWSAVLGAWWASWTGLAGFRRTDGQGGRRSDVPKPAADAGGGQPPGGCGLLLRPSQVFGQGASEAELGVGGAHRAVTPKNGRAFRLR
jgi:hypothetical protein